MTELNGQHAMGIALIIVFIVAIYYLTKSRGVKSNGYNIPDRTGSTSKFHYDSYPKISSLEKKIVPVDIKPNFIDIRFHNDYRDVQTAFNNIVPTNKQIFNIANQPIKYSQPNAEQVEDLVYQFIDELNKQTSLIPEVRNKNTGWDEAVVDANMESGWERQRKGLGLEPSLYPKPLGRTNLALVAIETIQKYETEQEVKFTVRIILQKEGAEDQMLIKVSFVIDTDSIHDENQLFGGYNQNQNVIIEEIFIEGFLSDHGVDAKKQYDMTHEKLAMFQKFADSEFQNMTDPKDIMRQLEKEYDKRRREMDMRNSILDPDAREHHIDKMHLDRTRSFQVTRTIQDDLMGKERIYV